MFHYFEDKEFISKMRCLGGHLLQDTCHILNMKYDIGAKFYLVGSGKRKLITQNEELPIDLDYNLEIVRCDDFEDCRYLKESTRKAYTEALNNEELGACEDSTSSLTSKQIYSTTGNKTRFSFDVCIVTEDNKGNYHRLIHEKTGFTYIDRYYWNIAPNSKEIRMKSEFIKQKGKWGLLQKDYLRVKNKYLSRNDHNHPSFICYIEAVNNVYNSRNNW